jgi:hypothetical protein
MVSATCRVMAHPKIAEAWCGRHSRSFRACRTDQPEVSFIRFDLRLPTVAAELQAGPDQASVRSDITNGVRSRGR